jgi:superfamily II DNA or RNA helicase
MSCSVPVSAFTELEKDVRQRLLTQCTVTSDLTREKIECFKVINDRAFLPLYYMEQNYPSLCEQRAYKPLSTTETTFTLREYQLAVKKEVDEIMSTFHSILLSLHCGWGKSYFAILYALQLGLQTLVTVYRVSHLDQWKDSIKSVNKSLKVQVLESKTAVKPDMDFYLILGENLAHRSPDEFQSVGTFIVDECHMFCTPSMSQSFFRVQPKYAMGLSATPFRTDRLDHILQLHFGYSMIRRKLQRPFNVYKYTTKMKPETRETARGDLDWSFVINSQAQRPERNVLIVKLCQFFRNRTIMILTKRVELHGEILLKMFQDAGESVDMFAGKAQTYDKNARILIATYSKAGVGFDNPKLDMLIVAGDVEEMFEQYMGRVFRRLDTVPIIIDMVDSFHVFEKHFQTRMLTYVQSGGMIKPFLEHFPEFIGF